VAALSCDDCCRWLVDEDWGFTLRDPGRQRIRRVVLPGRLSTPCGRCPKLPRDMALGERTPAAGRALGPSARSLRAIRHYLECKAVGRFPDDPIVRRNAWLLSEVERAFGQAERRQELQIVMASAGVGGKGR